MVRQRNRPGQGPSKAKRSLCRKDSSGSMSEIPAGKDEGLCWAACARVHHWCVLYNPDPSVLYVICRMVRDAA